MLRLRIWKAEFDVRKPTWYWAMRRTRIVSPQRNKKNVRTPAGPMGNQDQKSRSVSQERLKITVLMHLQDVQSASRTASMYDTINRIVAVEENRRCRAGCKKSL
jgi:hypothetical protein